MEVFGGFMMMLSIIGFFLTVIWFVLPFVIFSIKGRVDRTLEVTEKMEKRLSELERAVAALERPAPQQTFTSPAPPPGPSPEEESP
ncbi:hypothetical protein GMSM_28480 [Geomonas sp. Red276]